VPDRPHTTAGTVVIVDDNDTNLALLRRILARRPGLDVLSESDGRRALDLIRQRRPDLVLLDLNLPTMDGETVIRELRTDPATAAVPVVVISGNTDTATKQRLRAAGADNYLEKPLQITVLLDLIDDLLR
jgi:CheY-like chemotaxis protein